MIQHKDERHHGLNSPSDPTTTEVLLGAPPRQSQTWPGSDRDLKPTPDPGGETYRGGGNLTGKKALVTGGANGIGRAATIALAREGADVAISYYNEHDEAHETVHWLWEAGRHSLAEIAPSFVFLASEDGRFYSGEVLSPTGRPTTSR